MRTTDWSINRTAVKLHEGGMGINSIAKEMSLSAYKTNKLLHDWHTYVNQNGKEPRGNYARVLSVRTANCIKVMQRLGIKTNEEIREAILSGTIRKRHYGGAPGYGFEDGPIPNFGRRSFEECLEFFGIHPDDLHYRLAQGDAKEKRLLKQIEEAKELLESNGFSVS